MLLDHHATCSRFERFPSYPMCDYDEQDPAQGPSCRSATSSRLVLGACFLTQKPKQDRGIGGCATLNRWQVLGYVPHGFGIVHLPWLFLKENCHETASHMQENEGASGLGHGAFNFELQPQHGPPQYSLHASNLNLQPKPVLLQT